MNDSKDCVVMDEVTACDSRGIGTEVLLRGVQAAVVVVAVFMAQAVLLCVAGLLKLGEEESIAALFMGLLVFP
jgi:hypothetical protein